MGEPQAWRRFLSIFPRRPERRWDLISEAMARPFGTRAGRGPTRNGAVENGLSERAAAGHDGRALSVCRLGALTSGQPRAESLRSRHHEQQCCGSSSGVGSIGDHENARGGTRYPYLHSSRPFPCRHDIHDRVDVDDDPPSQPHRWLEYKLAPTQHQLAAEA